MVTDADRFAAQDVAHDLCEVNCGTTRMGVDCPVSITPDQQLYMNVLKRIMREQGVSLLQAHGQLNRTVGEAVDLIRGQWERGEL